MGGRGHHRWFALFFGPALRRAVACHQQQPNEEQSAITVDLEDCPFIQWDINKHEFKLWSSSANWIAHGCMGGEMHSRDEGGRA